MYYTSPLVQKNVKKKNSHSWYLPLWQVCKFLVSCVRVRMVYFMMHLKKMVILALLYKKIMTLSSIKIIETLDKPQNGIIFLFFITFN